MSASNELEKAATGYALDAVRLDKQGQKGRAITLYQKAIESLLQLVQLYPEYGLNKVYVQRAIAYQERIKALQGAVSSVEMNEASNNDGDSGGATMEGNGNGNGNGKPIGEELVITEKPKVNWDEVVGLETAKKAVKEAIVYPVQRPDLFPLGCHVAYCFSVHLAAAKLSWQQRLQRRLMLTSTPLTRHLSCLSGWVKLNRMLLNCSVQPANPQTMVNQP